MTEKSKRDQGDKMLVVAITVALIVLAVLSVFYYKNSHQSSAEGSKTTSFQLADSEISASLNGSDVGITKSDITMPSPEKTAPGNLTEPKTAKPSAPLTTADGEKTTVPSQEEKPVNDRIRTFPADAKLVALTFDDGPTPGLTDQILDSLSANNGRATFFMLGSRVENFPEYPKKVFEQGSEIGNHSWSHADLTTLSAAGIAEEVNQTNDILERSSGARPILFRPPYGAHNETVRANCGMPCILWNIDTLDWKIQDADNVISRLRADLHPGSIVLMHSLYDSTVEAVRRIVPELVQEGYTLCTVSEMLHHYGISLEAPGFFSGK